MQNAAERAYAWVCQRVSDLPSSPPVGAGFNRPAVRWMKRLREKYDLKPLVIHTNYRLRANAGDLF
jgi:hypothetical protein